MEFEEVTVDLAISNAFPHKAIIQVQQKVFAYFHVDYVVCKTLTFRLENLVSNWVVQEAQSCQGLCKFRELIVFSGKAVSVKVIIHFLASFRAWSPCK